MSTPRSQRIGIWIIAIVMTVGTLGSFLVMALSVDNNKNETEELQKAYTKYQSQINDQSKELSTKYYDIFKQYSNIPAKFDGALVTSLTKTDLKIGDGEEIKKGTPYSAYYIGWNPKGVVFDQSIKNDALSSPISGGSLIQGWEEGVIGMKIGGVRQLDIPSEKAYGNTKKSDDIPANTPLKFIVMVIPEVTEIPMPQIIIDAYTKQAATQQ